MCAFSFLNEHPMPTDVQAITDDLWPAILTLQREVYHTIEPESLEVMRGKWLASPEYCFVHRDGSGVGAYLLAHAWHSMLPPRLHAALPDELTGNILFVHDLAIAPRLAGHGVGRSMVEHLLRCAADDGKQSALLVAIQASRPFWSKFGFRALDYAPDASYGPGACAMLLAPLVPG